MQLFNGYRVRDGRRIFIVQKARAVDAKGGGKALTANAHAEEPLRVLIKNQSMVFLARNG